MRVCSASLLWLTFTLFFPSLVLRCATRCSAFVIVFHLAFPLSLSVSVFVIWVQEWEAVMFFSFSQMKQCFSGRWLDSFLSSHLFKLLDFYGYRDFSCPTFHWTFSCPFGKSRPWATLPSHLPSCVYSLLILPSLIPSGSSSVSYGVGATCPSALHLWHICCNTYFKRLMSCV